MAWHGVAWRASVIRQKRGNKRTGEDAEEDGREKADDGRDPDDDQGEELPKRPQRLEHQSVLPSELQHPCACMLCRW